MKLTMIVKKGNNPDRVTPTPEILPEVTFELEGSAEELMQFFLPILNPLWPPPFYAEKEVV
jgi:hypothetical protein